MQTLCIRALLCGLVWALFPFWAFALLASYFYFIPLFRPTRYPASFLGALIFSALLPDAAWAAALVALAIFVILGIKDMVIVERRGFYEAFIFGIMFTAFFAIYARFEMWDPPVGLFWLLGAMCLFYAMSREFLRETFRAAPDAGARLTSSTFLVAFLIWQMGAALFFLPVNFLYQTALLFLCLVILFRIVLEEAEGMLDRRRILVYASIAFVFLVFSLTAVEWGV